MFRPSQIFSFTDWMRQRPREPVPGDRIDLQFNELIRAIKATQSALSDIRSDDGKLRRGIVGDDQLLPRLRQQLLTDIRTELEPLRAQVRGTYSATIASEHQAELYAADAEAAARVAAQLTTGMEAIRQQAQAKADYVAKVASTTSSDAIDAQNWGNYAQAQADNAIAANNQALQWAEYLAGPVVDATAAPAYIASSPFPHGLYYQPVEGGLAGLWSAKWWALYAQQLVGKGSFYYLGAWTTPPVPGGTNPATGQNVPNPLSPGSLYYDLTSNTLYVWNGSNWSQQHLLTAAYTATYLYIATAGQTTFSGPDANGQTPAVGTSPSRVHVNGLLLTSGQYAIDATNNRLTLNTPAHAGDTVQWDLLWPSSQLAPVAVQSFKVAQLFPDGTNTAFAVQYTDPNSGNLFDTILTSSTDILVCQDGVLQEPGRDYTTSSDGYTSVLHMATAPANDAKLWAICFKPGHQAPIPAPGGPFILDKSQLGTGTLG